MIKARKNPVGWIFHALGLNLWSQQRKIAESVRDNPVTNVPAGHGVGKTAVAAAIARWFFECFYPATVVTTAGTWQQVEGLLWAEINAQHNNARTPALLHGKPLATSLTVHGPKKWFMIGLSPREKDPESLGGRHNEHVLIIRDEASGIPKLLWEAADSNSGGLTRVLNTGNPISTSGPFYDACRDRPETVTRISVLDSPNVVAGRNLIPGLTTVDWVEERRRKWFNTRLWDSRVLGKFPTTSENTLLSLAAIEAAQSVKATPSGPPILGADIARFGSDATLMYVRRGPAIVDVRERRKQDLMATVGDVIDLKRIHGVKDADTRIDDTGVGGGVTDRLREVGHNVVAVNAGSRAADAENYANARAEMWSLMADAVKIGALSLDNVSPDLIADLSTPAYSFTSKGQRLLEKKADIKKRTGRSPDHGDALGLTYATGGPQLPTEWVM